MGTDDLSWVLQQATSIPARPRVWISDWEVPQTFDAMEAPDLSWLLQDASVGTPARPVWLSQRTDVMLTLDTYPWLQQVAPTRMASLPRWTSPRTTPEWLLGSAPPDLSWVLATAKQALPRRRVGPSQGTDNPWYLDIQLPWLQLQGVAPQPRPRVGHGRKVDVAWLVGPVIDEYPWALQRASVGAPRLPLGVSQRTEPQTWVASSVPDLAWLRTTASVSLPRPRIGESRRTPEPQWMHVIDPAFLAWLHSTWGPRQRARAVVESASSGTAWLTQSLAVDLAWRQTWPAWRRGYPAIGRSTWTDMQPWLLPYQPIFAFGAEREIYVGSVTDTGR
jgi:hypothetical protein